MFVPPPHTVMFFACRCFSFVWYKLPHFTARQRNNYSPLHVKSCEKWHRHNLVKGKEHIGQN
jgi:hypothetical protein